MIEGIEATYAESTKDFATPNDLAKAYTELNARAASGDISLVAEEARKDPALSTFKNVNDLAKSFIETKKLVGTIKHAPAKPEEYKFTALKDLHAGLSAEGTQKFLATRLHALDIDNDRADKLQQEILLGLHNGMVQQDKVRADKAKEVETSLRGEWLENYDKNKANVENIFKRLGLEDYGREISGDPIKLKAMHKLTSLLSEDSIGKLGANTSTSADTKTKEGAKKALDEMMSDIVKTGKTHAFNDEKHKDHVATVKKYHDLTETAFS
jgi:cytochrome c553